MALISICRTKWMQSKAKIKKFIGSAAIFLQVEWERLVWFKDYRIIFGIHGWIEFSREEL